MVEARLRGHDELLDGLWRAAARGRLPHALCFQGPAGVGKFRAALRFVAGLLCARGPGPPCEECGACRRRGAGTHGGLYVLGASTAGLQVEPVPLEVIPIHVITPREDHRDVFTIEEFLALRSADGGWRAVVLRDFDRANASAQNALLKTLEEPGFKTVLVLETSRPELLLETVRSRCVRVPFGLLSPADSASVLAESGLEPEVARVLSRWCRGAPGRAFAMEREGALEMRAVIVALLGGELDGLEAGARLAAVEGAFEGKTPAASARARARAALELALSVARDLAHAEAGRPADELAHGDLAARLFEAGPRRITPGAIAAASDALARARRDVDANLAPEAILDRAMLALERLVGSTRTLPGRAS